MDDSELQLSPIGELSDKNNEKQKPNTISISSSSWIDKTTTTTKQKSNLHKEYVPENIYTQLDSFKEFKSSTPKSTLSPSKQNSFTTTTPKLTKLPSVKQPIKPTPTPMDLTTLNDVKDSPSKRASTHNINESYPKFQKNL